MTSPWLPMDTAPTERVGGPDEYPRGKNVLLRIEINRPPKVTYRCAEGFFALDRGVWQWPFEEGSGTPTHWQPLPSTDLT